MNSTKQSDSKSGFGRITLEQGPIEEVHAFWLAGMSCDGCSIAAVGAKNPSVDQLIRDLVTVHGGEEARGFGAW